jgi:hypothetical protein
MQRWCLTRRVKMRIKSHSPLLECSSVTMGTARLTPSVTTLLSHVWSESASCSRVMLKYWLCCAYPERDLAGSRSEEWDKQ